MTQKVIHNKNIINIKIGHTTKKKRRRSKHKKHHLIQHPHLPSYSSVIPNPRSSETNRPYYVETGSIHPLMLDQNKGKSVEIKDLITAPEPPPALTAPEPSTPSTPEHDHDIDEEYKHNLHEEFKHLQAHLRNHFQEQYNEPYNEHPQFEDQSKETEHDGVTPEIEDNVRRAGHPRGKTQKSYEKELKNEKKRAEYAMDPEVIEKRKQKVEKRHQRKNEESETKLMKKEDKQSKILRNRPEDRISYTGGGAGEGNIRNSINKNKKLIEENKEKMKKRQSGVTSMINKLESTNLRFI